MTGAQSPARILVVEDDPSIQLGLRMNLEREGYRVTSAADGARALALLRAQECDLCVLDVMLPQLNGYEVLRSMRLEKIETPVLFLSARTGDSAKVMGLDLGAEDYITKPFSVPELLARVRAVLRRNRRQSAGATHRVGPLTIDLAGRRVLRDDAVIDLTATEFKMLALLLEARGGALSRQQIFDAVWGRDHHGTLRTIDNFMAQLRGKLEDNPTSPALLLTVRGFGYRLAG